MANKTIPRIRTLLLLAVSAITFPSLANAGSYLYTVIDDGSQSGQKVTFSFDETTLASSGKVTSGFFNVTGGPPFAFGWNSAHAATCLGIQYPNFACAGWNFNNSPTGVVVDAFSVGSFLSTGTYTGRVDGLTVEISSIPEPSAVAVLGSGLLFVAGGLWRKQRS